VELSEEDVMYALKPMAEIVESPRAVYEVVQVVGYSLEGDALTLDVDNLAPYDRQYRVVFSPMADALEVVGHCAPGSDAPLDTSELGVAEAYDLLRYLETCPDVASKRAKWLEAALTEAP
jgi:hypothetical protein